nr:class I SAM-dependent methyltransferase [Streptomyces sp. SID5468]
MSAYRDPVAGDYWNHNTHYHRLVLDAVPAGCRAALDVGCGDGLLVSRLAARAREVTGVERSPGMLRLAAERTRHLDNVRLVRADFPAPAGLLPAGGYDLVTAVAVVHHMDFAEAVTAMRALLAPGGRLVLVGLARNATWWDWTVSAAGVPAAWLAARRHGGKSDPPGMPVTDPALSWGQVRAAARRLLPGCRIRRHLLWRWSLVWTRP